MLAKHAVQILTVHGYPTRVEGDDVLASVPFSRVTDAGIEYGEDWETVPSTYQGLRNWLGY